MKIVARQVIRQSMLQEGCPYDAEVSLLITDSDGIQAINREYRNIDRPTDVLSFPNLNFDAPSGFEDAAAKDPAGAFDPENGALVIGDIVINAQKVKEQAAEYGHSELREFAFLIAHSMLHLCGYDHMTPEEADVMEARQEMALQALGITRE